MGIILSIIAGIVFLFWTHLIRSKEYRFDPPVFWLTTLILTGLIIAAIYTS